MDKHRNLFLLISTMVWMVVVVRAMPNQDQVDKITATTLSGLDTKQYFGCSPAKFLASAKLITKEYVSAAAKRKRRSWTSLSGDEQQVYLKKLADPELQEMIKSFQCFHTADGQYGNFHTWKKISQLRFLPWHSLFLFHFEQILGVTIPYWDWNSNGKPLKDMLLVSDAFGSNGTCVTTKAEDGEEIETCCVDLSGSVLKDIPFSNDTNFYEGGCTQRKFRSSDAPLYNRQSEADLLASPNALSFLQTMDGIHGTMHGAIGGWLASHGSVRDPIFWSFHANFDRMWLRWLEKTQVNYSDTYNIPAPVKKYKAGNDLDGYPNINIEDFWDPTTFPVSYEQPPLPSPPTETGTRKRSVNAASSSSNDAVGLAAAKLMKLTDDSGQARLSYLLRKSKKGKRSHPTDFSLRGVRDQATDIADCQWDFVHFWTDPKSQSWSPIDILNDFISSQQTNSALFSPLFVQQLTNLVSSNAPDFNSFNNSLATAQVAYQILAQKVGPFVDDYLRVVYAYEILHLCTYVYSTPSVGVITQLGAPNYLTGDLLLAMVHTVTTDSLLAGSFSSHVRSFLKAQTISQDTPDTAQLDKVGRDLTKDILNMVGATPDTSSSPSSKKRNARRNPEGWTCAPHHYDTQDGCHCGCGIQDPDCDPRTTFVPENVPLIGCTGSSTWCTAGKCISAGKPPASWKCKPEYYNATDGCDCGCGAPDPDCDADYPPAYRDEFPYLYTLYGCLGGKDPYCTSDSKCAYRETVPTSWNCPVNSYNSGDACDCACGAFDPDCLDMGLSIVGCSCSSMTCRNPKSQGICQGTCGSLTVSVFSTNDPTTAAPTSAPTAAPTTCPPAPPCPTIPPNTCPPPVTNCPVCPTLPPQVCPACPTLPPSTPAPTPAPSSCSGTNGQSTKININFQGLLNGYAKLSK